ncbi:MAG: hypothetical protein AAGH87_02085 [Pseudomonadota bacterium]
MKVPFLLFAASLLGVAVSAAFVFIGVFGDVFDVPPPLFLRAILVAGGAFFALVSLSALWHAARQTTVRRSQSPVRVMVEVETFADSETTTYDLHISCDDALWIAPVYGGKAVRRLQHSGPQPADAWLDPRSGAPLALELDGLPLVTYPVIRRAGPGG